MVRYSSQYEPMIHLSRWLPYGADKNPINPDTGKPASSNYPGCYSWAIWHLNRPVIPFKPAPPARGIGFCPKTDDPIGIIDFDLEKIDTLPPKYPAIVKQIVREACDWVRTLTLCERSPSGKGVHAYGYILDPNTQDIVGTERHQILGCI